ncbi:MAG: hypothetical protein A2Y25_08995 [Candidatus Melainabacteria bacterium GWF2_37_15]|nr:MAG: hypothetical protein A2Y25_08995 [Candidatus Melainabacteria bacterium GWF2_37_15]
MPNYKRCYEQNKFVFITIVTFNRISILINNIDLLKNSYKSTLEKYPFENMGMVILPNHIHMLIKPKNMDDYPKIISLFKATFSRNINNTMQLTKSQINKREKGIWQRRYWAHVIWDEKDFENHFNYIHYNPVKHRYVENVKDWKHSTFFKMVKLGFYDINWGSENEVSDILDLDYE